MVFRCFNFGISETFVIDNLSIIDMCWLDFFHELKLVLVGIVCPTTYAFLVLFLLEDVADLFC